MRIPLLFSWLLLSMIVNGQSEIVLKDGQLWVSNTAVSIKTNQPQLDQAMGMKSVNRYITSTYNSSTNSIDPTNYYQVLYKESAIAFRLSAPEKEIEEIVIRLHMEPLFDLPKRLQKRTYPLYQGNITIGNTILNQQVTTATVHTLFDPKDILVKEVRCIGNHPVPYMVVRHHDWLVELVFSITSNQLKNVVLKH
jgi:hypothetical protein